MAYEIVDISAPSLALFKKVAEVASLDDAKVWLVDATMQAFGSKPYNVVSEYDAAEDGIDYFASAEIGSTTLMFAVNPIKA